MATIYQPLQLDNNFHLSHKQPKTSWLKTVLLMAALFFVLRMFMACSYQDDANLKMNSYTLLSSQNIAEQAIEKQWGVRPVSVQLTATDYMLDFRYKVLNAEKADSIVNRKTKPYMIVEKTGVRLDVPASYKVGPLRQSAQFSQPNRNYFMLFANPGRKVKAGDKVTIVAGDLRIENLTVN